MKEKFVKFAVNVKNQKDDKGCHTLIYQIYQVPKPQSYRKSVIEHYKQDFQY